MGSGLAKYLRIYQRDARLPIGYGNLLDFTETVPVVDKHGNGTLIKFRDFALFFGVFFLTMRLLHFRKIYYLWAK